MRGSVLFLVLAGLLGIGFIAFGVLKEEQQELQPPQEQQALLVTFTGTTSQDEARALLSQLGLEEAAQTVAFEPVYVEAAMPDSLDPDTLLASHPAVVSVEVVDLKARTRARTVEAIMRDSGLGREEAEAVASGMEDSIERVSAIVGSYALQIGFRSSILASEAEATVRGVLGPVVKNVTKLPNQVRFAVPAADVNRIVEALEASPLVAGVEIVTPEE